MSRHTVGAITVREPVEVLDRSFQTASEYARITLTPGDYPLTGTFSPEGVLTSVSAVLPGVETEHYRVNTLLSASSVQHDTDTERPSTYGFHAYPYQERVSHDGAIHWALLPLPAAVGGRLLRSVGRQVDGRVVTTYLLTAD
jgi:hypothetical protein